MSRREFLYQDSQSEQFWAIELKDNTHTVNYGKVGSHGQTQTKTFETTDLAQKSHDRLIAEKLKQGYVEQLTSSEIQPQPESSCQSVTEDLADPVTPQPLPTEAKEQPGSEFDQQKSPAGALGQLEAEIAKLLNSRSKRPAWVDIAALPRITLGSDPSHCLTEDQLLAVLIALRNSSLDSPHPLIPLLKQQADPVNLDEFVWSLFQLWLGHQAPSKEKWAMAAVGLLGSDVSVFKLTPLIRSWPGESQHQRAVFGLQCLRAIGTDGALMQINSIAQKIKYRGLKSQAEKCMEQLAQERGLSRDQLEDRIVPTLDLDQRGSRVFDYGPRQFILRLQDDLKPVIQDPAGKIKTTLPKPNSKDDQAKAMGAMAEWKVLKKQIQEIFKIQIVRLEIAMAAERCWDPQDFQTFLAQHPLMTHLAQRLVWGGFDLLDQLVKTFRVIEDQTLADVEDNEITLAEIHQIKLLHPLHLTPELRSAWSQVLGDYEIIPPFPQLSREVYTLNPEEKEAKEITRFQERSIPVISLVRGLENRGWRRGELHDHGDYSVHYKYFASSDLTAIVGDYQFAHVDTWSMGDDAETLDRCGFVSGVYEPGNFPDERYRYPGYKPLEPLNRIPAIVLSEVLRDLYLVTT